MLSNHGALRDLAGFYGVPFESLPVTDAASKHAFEARVVEAVEAHNIELVVLARYMQILSPEFIGRYPERMINVHHSFLPAFVGAHPYRQAAERGVKLIGATAHYVTSILDEGPIIDQDVVRVSHRDDVERLAQKGRDLEAIVLARAVRAHVEGRVLVYGNRTVVFS